MNKREPSSNESSLLLKYSSSLFSPLTHTENILMPVGAQNTSGVVTVTSENGNSDGSDTRTSSICQLEQPLLFGGATKPKNTNDNTQKLETVASIQSVVSLDESLGHLNITSSSSVPTTTTSFNAQAPPFYPSTSPQVDISAPMFRDYSEPPQVLESTPALLEPVATYSFDSSSHTSYSQSGFPTIPTISGYNFQESNIIPTDSTVHHSTFNTFDPIKPYWLFQDTVESKEIWYGFSEMDSENLEKSYQQGLEVVVPTDGGRHDVYLQARTKKSVYFDSKELHVRRCTWYYQEGSSVKFKPYDENTAIILEEYYHKWVTSGAQESRFTIPGITGSFLFEIPYVMLHFGADTNTWTVPNDPKGGTPKVMKRGLPDCFQIMPNESPKIDHLLFIVQGIGQFCDLRFRTVSECVDGLRDISNKLIGSHFKSEVEQGFVGRVEILPVAWHAKLHTSDIGLDWTMKMITLPSIPKLRHFTNDTLIDILLYSSPSYCQSIINTVAEELNHIYEIFLSRNPTFDGKIFVAGHSLGSLILFDILSNQNSTEQSIEKEPSLDSENPQDFKYILEKFSTVEDLLKSLELEEFIETFSNEKIDISALPYLSDEDLKNIGVPLGPRRKLINILSSKEKMNSLSSCNESCSSVKNEPEKEEIIASAPENTAECNNRMIYPLHKPNTGMSSIIYPKLLFHPVAFFALGSPISMFLAIRGFDSISEKFNFPTCSGFFHIFHPYDPVAFRIEPLIDHKFREKPVLIPHHKGRKRMHLEIKENVAKFASEIRQKVMDTLHKTWHSFNEITGFHPFPSAIMEHEVNSMVSQELPEIATDEDQSLSDVFAGNLNSGRRIDYVLQEKPLEALNDYVWALTSHATYWDSEDTVLMILREIYAIQGINVSPVSEGDTSVSENSFSNRIGIKEYVPFSQEFLEKTLYPHFPTSSPSQSCDAPPLNTKLPIVVSNESRDVPLVPVTSAVSAPIPGSQHIGPPPLSGFVKRSAFSK